jgi:uridine kinase
MSKLYLVRGLPGSGKSTLARRLDADCIFEADQYMMEDGVYVFKPEKLHYAHSKCLQETINELSSGWIVAVANTFTTGKELAPYIKAAKEIRLEKKDVIIINVYGAHGSIHNVPEETMQKMRDRFDHNSAAILEKYWNEI